MQISLRKSNALQSSILEAIKSMPLISNITLNEFQPVKELMSQAKTALDSNLSRLEGLYDALYEIRAAVGNSNSSAGVSDRLAAIAKLEKMIKHYTTVVEFGAQQDEILIEGKLDKIRKSTSTGEEVRHPYGRQIASSTVESSVLTEEDLVAFKLLVANKRREKQKLQDEVLELNIQVKITLSDKSVAALQKENLI